MFCPKCGRPNDDNSKFCFSCGTALAPSVHPKAQHVYTPASPLDPPKYIPSPDKKSGIGTAAAIIAIVAFLTFFLPWISLSDWFDLSLSYFDMVDASGDLGYFVDNAKEISAALIFSIIVFSIPAITAIIKGFRGNADNWDLLAGVIGIVLFFVFAMILDLEFECIGAGAYLFLALSVSLIVLSRVK